MGRNKITIEKITNERNRQATFTKRKNGLFKKAMELSILCDCEVALIVITSGPRMFQYSSVEMEKILTRYHEHVDRIKPLTNDDYFRQFNGSKEIVTKDDFLAEAQHDSNLTTTSSIFNNNSNNPNLPNPFNNPIPVISSFQQQPLQPGQQPLNGSSTVPLGGNILKLLNSNPMLFNNQPAASPFVFSNQLQQLQHQALTKQPNKNTIPYPSTHPQILFPQQQPQPQHQQHQQSLSQQHQSININNSNSSTNSNLTSSGEGSSLEDSSESLGSSRSRLKPNLSIIIPEPPPKSSLIMPLPNIPKQVQSNDSSSTTSTTSTTGSTVASSAPTSFDEDRALPPLANSGENLPSKPSLENITLPSPRDFYPELMSDRQAQEAQFLSPGSFSAQTPLSSWLTSPRPFSMSPSVNMMAGSPSSLSMDPSIYNSWAPPRTFSTPTSSRSGIFTDTDPKKRRLDQKDLLP